MKIATIIFENIRSTSTKLERKHRKFKDAERLFSKSSITSHAVSNKMFSVLSHGNCLLRSILFIIRLYKEVGWQNLNQNEFFVSKK